MKIQVRSLAIALAIAVPIVGAATAESSAARSMAHRSRRGYQGRGKSIHLEFVPGHPSYDYSYPGYACDGW
ncbi:hypothetical protein ABIG04_009975 [Bradyrhizobium japonicum]